MKKVVKVLFVILLNILLLIGLKDIFLTAIGEYKYTSIIIFIMVCLNFLAYRNILINKENLKENALLGILSIIYSLCIICGFLIDKNYNVYNFDLFSKIGSLLLDIYAIGALLFPIIKKLYNFIKKGYLINKEYKYKKWWFIILFVVLFASWIPYFINFYPGLMSPDSLNQWAQAAGLIDYSNHHPIAHTMLIKLFYLIGKFLHNPSLGVAFYSLFQMAIMALVFAYGLYYLLKKKVSIWFIISCILIYSVVPVFGYYSVTVWKDVLFGAGSYLLMIQLFKYLNEKEFKVFDIILLIFSVLWVGVFRTNGLYVAILIGIICVLFIKGKRKQSLLFILIPAICAYIITGPIYSLCGISKTEFTENIGVMIKQIYAVEYDKKHISKKNEQYLGKLVKKDEALMEYDPFSDHIKMAPSYNNEFLEKNKIEFMKVWLIIGLEHPRTYVNSYFKATYGFWYPEAQGYLVHKWPISENEMNLHSYSKFDKLKINGYIEKFYNEPLLKYLTSDALYFWIALFSLVVIIIKKKYKNIIPLLLIVLVWGTIMVATPLSYQPRYTYANYCCFPLLIYIGLASFEKDNKNC